MEEGDEWLLAGGGNELRAHDQALCPEHRREQVCLEVRQREVPTSPHGQQCVRLTRHSPGRCLRASAPVSTAAADGRGRARPPRRLRAERFLELSAVAVVANEPYHPGYDRDCDPGACVFGEPWTDDHDGPFAHNGCTTREDVLLQQMRDIELRWGSRCRIYDARSPTPIPADG